MNQLDRLLVKTPDSDDAWHCPWFRVIEAFAANGVFWGGFAYFYYGEDAGLFAVIIGLLPGMFAFGTRTRKATSC